MTAIELENAEALAEIYENDFVDASTGKQAESVRIDGKDVPGHLSFDKTEIDLVPGGWNENVEGMFSTAKSYFPGSFPKPFKSSLICIVGGSVRNYQVVDLNGDKNNDASLTIGLAAYTNRKS